MKITGATTTLFTYEQPLSATEVHSSQQATNCVLELQTDSGISGIAIGGKHSLDIIHKLVKHVLLAKDPRAVLGLWQQMQDFCVSLGPGLMVSQAISALDVALWDIKAKANNEPLWRTLGSTQPKANVYASYRSSNADENMTRWFLDMASQFGIREGKLNIGSNQDVDLKRLTLMQDALQSATTNPTLLVNANECWSPKQAQRKIKDIEKHFDLTFVEAPCLHSDFLGIKRISNSIRAAVVNSGGVFSVAGLLPFFNHHALNVVQISLENLGITGCSQIADAAYGFELPVSLSEYSGNIQAHIAGSMPYFMNMEVIEPRPSTQVVQSSVEIIDGWATVGSCIGHGINIDRNVLAKTTIECIST